MKDSWKLSVGIKGSYFNKTANISTFSLSRLLYFHAKFLKEVPYEIAISQIARWIWRYFEVYFVIAVYLHWVCGKNDEVPAAFKTRTAS